MGAHLPQHELAPPRRRDRTSKTLKTNHLRRVELTGVVLVDWASGRAAEQEHATRSRVWCSIWCTITAKFGGDVGEPPRLYVVDGAGAQGSAGS